MKFANAVILHELSSVRRVSNVFKGLGGVGSGILKENFFASRMLKVENKTVLRWACLVDDVRGQVATRLCNQDSAPNNRNLNRVHFTLIVDEKLSSDAKLTPAQNISLLKKEEKSSLLAS